MKYLLKIQKITKECLHHDKGCEPCSGYAEFIDVSMVLPIDGNDCFTTTHLLKTISMDILMQMIINIADLAEDADLSALLTTIMRKQSSDMTLCYAKLTEVQEKLDTITKELTEDESESK